MSEPGHTGPAAGLTALLHLRPGEALAVVGAGGKTSVIGLLAAENSGQKVLVMPTTKIRPPEDFVLFDGAPRFGVQYAGAPLPETSKLAAPPKAEWAALAAKFDLTLMEADGSRGLPCKGWATFEPVAPPFATRTLGVVTTAGLGRPADGETVLRLPEFLALTGLAEGEAITMGTLAAMVAAPGGMFKGAAGEKVLLINQVEDGPAMGLAERLADLIRAAFPGAVDAFCAGSAHQNRWAKL